jgi:hypothetical protein
MNITAEILQEQLTTLQEKVNNMNNPISYYRVYVASYDTRAICVFFTKQCAQRI